MSIETFPSISKVEFLAYYRKELLKMQETLSKEKQTELPLLHDFAPGFYLRRIFMPKDTFVIGKTHKTEHFNVVLAGAANVMIDGVIKFIKAPAVFTSEAKVKKVLWILEDMIWMTTHPTQETCLDKLEKLLILSNEEEKTIIDEELEKIAIMLNLPDEKLMIQDEN